MKFRGLELTHKTILNRDSSLFRPNIPAHRVFDEYFLLPTVTTPTALSQILASSSQKQQASKAFQFQGRLPPADLQNGSGIL
jgi:hypothetical protein